MRIPSHGTSSAGQDAAGHTETGHSHRNAHQTQAQVSRDDQIGYDCCNTGKEYFHLAASIYMLCENLKKYWNRHFESKLSSITIDIFSPCLIV